jgi:5-methylcytosine-specific restriction protein A
VSAGIVTAGDRCDAVPPRTFRRWLLTQRHRNDPIGDLAREVRMDTANPAFPSIAEWVRYLPGAADRASIYYALLSAWREFARSARSRPNDRKPPRERVMSPQIERALLRAAMAGDMAQVDRLRAQWHSERAPRSISIGARARILERDGFRCRRCGASPEHTRLVIDHIVPVASGGSGDEANLQTLCDPCNQGKGARPPHAHDMERS